MTPALDQRAAALILYDEGERLKPYADSVGVLSIGVGHNLSNGVSKAVSELMFAEDRTTASASLDKMLPWWSALPENAQIVLMNMCFNMGIYRLMGFHGFLSAMKVKQWAIAADHLLDSKAAKQLPNRYKRLAQLLRAIK